MTRSPALSGIASTERNPAARTCSGAQAGSEIFGSSSTSGVQTHRSSATARPAAPSPTIMVRPRHVSASPMPAAAMQRSCPVSRCKR